MSVLKYQDVYIYPDCHKIVPKGRFFRVFSDGSAGLTSQFDSILNKREFDRELEGLKRHNVFMCLLHQDLYNIVSVEIEAKVQIQTKIEAAEAKLKEAQEELNKAKKELEGLR